MTSEPTGALPQTVTLALGVAADAERAAGRAAHLADQLTGSRDRLLTALGGGPPPEVLETGGLCADAIGGLEAARTALTEAAAALRAFATRTR